MIHREIYRLLVCVENQHLLHPLIERACASIGYKFLDMFIYNNNEFMYIECHIDTDEYFHAVMIGFILDIRNIVPECNKANFYLPVILFCPTYKDEISQHINKDRAIKHELVHIKDILDIIEQDQNYPDKVMQFSMSKQDLSVEELPKSIEFEMTKLLNLEPKALQEDYKNGENFVLIPLNNGKIYRHDNVPLDLFIKIKIGTDIARIKDAYLEKFSNNPMAKKLILRHIKQAVVRYGNHIFQNDIHKILKNLQ